MIELIPESGRFYKVNLHCHTDISDGADSRETVKAFYKANGYSAVCFTDHEILLNHKDLCDADFIALHGYEVAIKQDIRQHTGWSDMPEMLGMADRIVVMHEGHLMKELSREEATQEVIMKYASGYAD